MKAKKLISLLLVIAMLSSFVACKGDNNNTDVDNNSDYNSSDNESDGDNSDGENPDGENPDGGSSTDGTSSGGNSGTNSGKNNLVGNTYLSGFPIVKNQESLKIMAVTRAGDIGDTNKSQFTKTYSQMTNIKITFELSEQNKVAQKKTLALQSGNLPDIFARGCGISDQDVQQYSAEGTFVEITKDMLKKWAPNIYKFYDDYDLWDMVKSTDGKMYSIAGGTLDYQYDQHYLWINTTWLKKLGLSMPKTMNEFYNVLRAFKDKDPNGNGQKDEIPYATWSSNGFFTHPWGVWPGIFVNSKGKVCYGGATENMKKCATFWNKVYKENLVDKNTIDNWAGENAAFQTLIASGKVGAFYWGWPDTLSADLMSQFEICPWPTSGENNGEYYPVYTNVYESFYPDAFFITKKCKNVPAALRFLDYLYTNDGYMLSRYGNPGFLYTKVSDKLYKPTGKSPASTDLLGPKWTMTGRFFLVDATYAVNNTSNYLPKREAADKIMASRVKQYNQKTVPSNYMSKTEIKSINQYSTYFNSMISVYQDYVKGNKSLTSDWTTMINEFNSKGLNKYLAAWQTYYDRVTK